MGQVHSDEYSCGDDRTATHRVEDVADSEINTKGDSTITTIADQQQQPGKPAWKTRTDEKHQLRQQHVRKLSNVSHRNIQLLSMKPRSDKDAYADDLRTRRRSSLINLILGAPSSGPRFCDDLCSLSSYMSETNFGIESFPEPAHYGSSSTLRLASIEDTERGSTTGDPKSVRPTQSVAAAAAAAMAASLGGQRTRRSSVGSLAAGPAAATGGVSENPAGRRDTGVMGPPAAPPVVQDRRLWAKSRNPSLASTLASIDLSSSFEQHDKSCSKLPMPLAAAGSVHSWSSQRPPLVKSRQLTMDCPSEIAKGARSPGVSRGRVNQSGRILRRSGSELSLYSTISASSAGTTSQRSASSRSLDHSGAQMRETKLIILLQVALPFMLAGFGNMAAGLVLDVVSQKHAFVSAPILFVLLPPLIGLKGNIEMTLASRLSTLSNLNLLQTRHQKSKAFASNLTLVISQAIGLSLFAALVSVICELSMLGSHSTSNEPSLPVGNTTLAVFASALITSVVLVVVSSVMMSCAVGLANLIQVNPDNLSTLIAALYGDVSCVYVYGLVADWTFSLVERDLLIWPSVIVISTLLLWPLTLFMSYKFKETHSVAFYSIPPMIISILISMGSGALLSLFVGKFRLIALYQPVVNGFGANLVAVQASRVSTWLWCSALGKLPINSGQGPIREQQSEKIIGHLASFTAPPILSKADPEPGPSICWKPIKMVTRSAKLLLWSFCNSSPNAIAAKLLLLMLIPAHTIYFFVIWLLSATSHVVITWPFYSVYIGLCLVQVFILLTICEPFMTLLMSRNMDPDVFGISILMAVADLTGTICLTSAFFLLASIGDVNALQ